MSIPERDCQGICRYANGVTRSEVTTDELRMAAPGVVASPYNVVYTRHQVTLSVMRM
ncbi:UNVERIFIED_ORG: hypothetical protein ABIC54_005953 [Burkholderia sp. 1263]